MLSAIFSAVGVNLVDSILGKVTGAFESYFKKQISIEELKTRVRQAMLEAFVEVEKSHAEALAKTYDAFMQAMQKSRLIQVTWAAVVLSQLVVLIWHQAGIPALCFFLDNKACYPSSGATVEWAYLLLAGCLGMAPVVLRSGPGAGSIADKIRGLVR